ncbi:MAG: zinc ribbon domain-containing protein [Verrucomicrobia bacterium]|nr:MAG: zinc ribbon domain-containing protein [Verrucomicrobiota bacterium]
MPLHEYIAEDPAKGCELCRRPFEHLDRQPDHFLKSCPRCGAPVRRLPSAPNITQGHTTLDRRAREAGFHKLKRVGKGTYEKEY